MKETLWFFAVLDELRERPEVLPHVLEGLLLGDEAILPEAIDALAKALDVLESVGAQPVRGKRAAAWSTLRGAAVILLRLCEKRNLPPPTALVDLIRRLFDVDRQKSGVSRAFQAKQWAVLHVSMMPEITPTELAKAVNVNKSTASRWLRDPEFRSADASLQTIQALNLEGSINRRALHPLL